MNGKNMRTICIYHSADFDGVFCREIFKKFLNGDADYVGWNFGDDLIDVTDYGIVYVADLPPECVKDVESHIDDIVWVDHHKSSIEKWKDSGIGGYRIDGVAACRLLWHFFAVGAPTPKEAFIDHEVDEPYAVQLAGEYDVWDKRNPQAETFQYGLRCDEPNWAELLEMQSNEVLTVISRGLQAQAYAKNVNASICKSRTWLMEWEGLKFLCVNTAQFNSLLFDARDKPETGHDALLGFNYNGKCWTVSMYHARHRTDLDLSTIAVKHGGGGHKGACGFTCATLPFADLIAG